jgi:co-chaperonin GroES (HSP10)
MTFKEEKEFVKEKARALKIELPERWYLPKGNTCLVARLPPKNRTDGGLWLAGNDEEIPNYGVLIGAGLKAREDMADALIEIGDVVKFGKFDGDVEEFEREKMKQGRYILQIKIEGINGSIEADKRAEDCTIEFQDTADGGRQMFYVPVNDIKRKVTK